MAYKKNKNRDKKIQLFLDVLNLKELNKPVIDKIHENYLGYPTQLDEGGFKDLVNTFNALRTWAHSIVEDPIKNASSANELAIWCSEQIPPVLFVGRDLKIQVDKPEDGPAASIEELLAKEILSTFFEISFDHLQCCHQCNTYFFSFRSNARYCSIGCIRTHDRLKNGHNYVKAVRQRRAKGIYVPICFFACPLCKARNTKDELRKNRALKKKYVRCTRCKKEIKNRFLLSK